jgi:hypothetical protein
MKGRRLFAQCFGCWGHSWTEQAGCQSEQHPTTAEPQDVATAAQGLEGACSTADYTSREQQTTIGCLGSSEAPGCAGGGLRGEGLISPGVADKKPRASMRTSCAASILLATISDVGDEELGAEWRESDDTHVGGQDPSCRDCPASLPETSSGPLTMHQAQLTGSVSTSDHRLSSPISTPRPSLSLQHQPGPSHQGPSPQLPPPAAQLLPPSSVASGLSTALTSTSGDPFPSSPFKDASVCSLGAPQLTAEGPWSQGHSLEPPRTFLDTPRLQKPFAVALAPAPSHGSNSGAAHQHAPHLQHPPSPSLSPRNSPMHRGFPAPQTSSPNNAMFGSGSYSGLTGISPPRSTANASARLAASGRLFLFRRWVCF